MTKEQRSLNNGSTVVANAEKKTKQRRIDWAWIHLFQNNPYLSWMTISCTVAFPQIKLERRCWD